MQSLVEIKLKRHQSNGLSTERQRCLNEMDLILGHLSATLIVCGGCDGASAAAAVVFLPQETVLLRLQRFISATSFVK